LALRVILDSNFLFVPSQFRVDIFEELARLLNRQVEPVLLSPTEQELRRLAEEAPPKIRRQASLALELAGRCRMVHVDPRAGESHDDVVVRVAREWGCPVATNDRGLRGRLRGEGVPVVFLRQRARLEVEGYTG